MFSSLSKPIIAFSCALSMICACESSNEMSLQDANVEMFLYDSPITSMTDAGDELLLGTARGDIVAFSLSDGTFDQIYHDKGGRFIYKVVKAEDDSYFYSVQDGGINHIMPDGTVHTYRLNSYKEDNYSAYDIVLDGNEVYAATSNGVYYWTSPEEYADKRLDECIQSDQNDAVLCRFYSIEVDDKDAFMCAGEAGLYTFDLNESAVCTNHDALYSHQENISLSRDGVLYKDGQELTTLNISAIDFVCDGKYIYAMSLYGIEIVDRDTGSHLATINLPERKSIYKNTSCRSFCTIKDDYVYVVPGGCTMYRFPIYADLSSSEEVVNVCAAGNGSAYFLTLDNNLYRFDISSSEVDYRRSFDESNEIQLIGGDVSSIIVTIDGVYYELSGKRLTDERYLQDLNDLNKSKVLWHLMDDVHLYQGQVDRIRAYSKASGWNLSQELDQLDYPNQATMCRNGLIINTLHEGRFMLSEGRFEKFDGLSDVQLKDIDGRDNFACGLTDSEIILKTMTKDNYRIGLQENTSYYHLTDLIALSEREFVLFSSYNRWCKGIVKYEEQIDGSWKSSRSLKTHTVNDAVQVGEYVVAGGTMGLCVLHSNDEMSVVYVPAPTFFEKNVLAWHYPWGIVIYVSFMILDICALIWCAVLCRRYYLKYRMKKMSESFRQWTETEFKGKYIRSMAKQLVKVSGNCKRLEENVSLFKSSAAQLKELDAFIDDVVDLYDKVKSMKAQDIELGHRDEINLLKDRLEYFCKANHAFGSSIIKEWGKTTVQPIRTLMLLPLKLKIKYMQIFDSRTGTEKMDFKAFMDKNKEKILKRKLEIRDFIAFSAYEAIISEKGTTDA